MNVVEEIRTQKPCIFARSGRPQGLIANVGVCQDCSAWTITRHMQPHLGRVLKEASHSPYEEGC